MPPKTTTSRATKETGEKRGGGSRRGANVREPIMEFASTTSSIVQEAASILEEEIAAGIVAAKRVEEEFLDPEDLRKGDHTTQRLRKDVHDAVDILMDVLEAATRAAGRATTAAKGETRSAARPKPRRGRAK